MLYVYADRRSTIETLRNVQNIKLIVKNGDKWNEPKNIKENDVFLMIGGVKEERPRYEDQMLGNWESRMIAEDKISGRQFLENKNISVPKTWYDIEEAKTPFIARPIRHSRNANFHIVRTEEERNSFIDNIMPKRDAWYFSEVIDVKREYRVMVLNFEIFLVYNRALYGSVENTMKVRSIFRKQNRIPRYECQDEVSEENLQLSINAMKALNLSYGAVDLMIDQNGKGYIAEINTAPSLGSDFVKRYLRNAVAKLAQQYK